METNTFPLLIALDQVYQKAENSQLQSSVLESLQNEVVTITQVFPITPTQAVFLAVVLGEGNTEKVGTKRIGDFLGMTPLQLMPHLENLQGLKEKNILMSKFPRLELNDAYQLHPNLLPYLLRNEPIPKEIFERNEEAPSLFSFLSAFQDLKEEKEQNNLQSRLFKFHFIILLSNYTQFPFVAYMSKKMPPLDAMILCETLYATIQPSSIEYPVNISSLLDVLTDQNTERMQYMQDLIAGTTALQTLQLIEKNQELFANRIRIKLSEKCMELVGKMEGIPLIQKKQASKWLHAPEKTPKITLVYNPKEAASIATIDQALQAKQFAKIQQQLRSKHLPVGLNCLLYGPPGTGKTATVYQLARKHKRAIFKVEISEVKSMWYGESQKLVKKIFTDYENAKQYEKHCPILLFNEADALISKREGQNSRISSQTDNAIQNILLEELENFEGIFFATTNLVVRLDPAFERRFLFKICLEAPTPENAAKIWKLKIPSLRPSECMTLANQFAFSPGEMENIARKMLLQEIMHGQLSSFAQVVAFCEEEHWLVKNSSKNPIGF